MKNSYIKIFKISIFLTFMIMLSLNAQTAQQKLRNEMLNSNLLKVEVVNDKKGDEVYKIKYLDSGKIIYKDFSEHKKRGISNIDKVDTTRIIFSEIDTTQFTDLYDYWMTIPVSSTIANHVLLGDFNDDKQPEIYGRMYDTRPYEKIDKWVISNYDSLTEKFNYVYTFPDSGIDTYTVTGSIYDIDKDGRNDLYLIATHTFQNDTAALGIGRSFNNLTDNQLPTNISFDFIDFSQINDSKFGDFNNDGITDYVYFKMTDPTVKIGEYNTATNNIDTVYEYYLISEDFGASGFATGDVDGDGYSDLTLGGLHGDFWVYEYQPSIENYKMVFKGDAGINNAYHNFNTNDIDKNGKKEFWVGGDGFYNGVGMTKFTCFEADGNNSYHPVHVIEIEGVFSFFAFNSFAMDVDNDGTEELVFCLEQTFFIFKFTGSPNNPSYKLFYYKYNSFADTKNYGIYFGATMFDIDNNRYPEIIINQSNQVIQPGDDLRYDFTIIYKPSTIVSVEDEDNGIPNTFELNQNYPNPFNPSTIISYQVAERSNVKITVFDVLGKKIKELVNQEQRKGNYQTTFDGSKLTSGIYLVRMIAGNYSKTIKTLLLK